MLSFGMPIGLKCNISMPLSQENQDQAYYVRTMFPIEGSKYTTFVAKHLYFVQHQHPINRAILIRCSFVDAD